MTELEEFEKELMKDPEFVREYNKLKHIPEFTDKYIMLQRLRSERCEKVKRKHQREVLAWDVFHFVFSVSVNALIVFGAIKIIRMTW